MKKISVGILGATSYTGVELIRMLAWHPGVDISFISSQSHASERLTKIFPALKGIFDDTLISPQEAQQREPECIFSCLPHAVSAGLLVPFLNKGIRVIDLSADFRIKDLNVYKNWYKIDHPAPEFMKKAMYGLPEKYRNEIKDASIIANPGCYVTSVILPLLPLFSEGAEKIEWIIADSKSGVSGAGRALKLTTHFVEANENFSAYSIGHSHRHTPEIEQELSFAANKSVEITFSPHLVPINRGILSTIYIKTSMSAAQCSEIVQTAYKDEPFVRLRDSSDLPKVSGIAHTNYCDIAFSGGENGQPVIAVSALDNLIKGASGQALQNMNIMFGFAETEGLLR
ncbi:N-acetyl-gamma-glutamyl-phosphate reductase [Chitinispirillales bacterium ANBcel5]|uniref:N-acetyl-gamma-glutamyl-phosphate reductase n=1 Tax=Cellulosispirillum alkaliphilum TaxID=3039283 RepID=UPI002A505A33|nr:N-acetyl-gamma-glutamyl-phosphate reductase [Chitinispirillales bacterium ANBcel5]